MPDEEDYSDVAWKDYRQRPEPEPAEVEICRALDYSAGDRYSSALHRYVVVKAEIKLHISGSYNPQIKAREKDFNYATTISQYYAKELHDLIKTIPVESAGTAWFSIKEDDENEQKWYISPRLAHAIQKFMENLLEIEKEEALRRSEYEKYKSSESYSADDSANKFVMNQKMISHDLTVICHALQRRIAALESKFSG